MRNCLILGCARSGTSMIAGMLHDVGYHIGDDYIAPREANPKGFFEDSRLNALNDRLVARSAPRAWRPVAGTRTPLRARPRKGMWAARLSEPVETMPEELAPVARTLIEDRRPFAYKDPRFCYTLPAWRPFLPSDVRFVCIFREPARTANSIVKEVEVERGLYGLRAGGLTLTYERALQVWVAMYTSVLSQRHSGDWLFVHYDRVLEGQVDPIADFLGVVLRTDFPDVSLRRSPNTGWLTREAEEVYRTLLELA